MQLLRMFSNEKYKGKKDYLKTQKIYELLRTVLYFGISASLFVAGFAATGERTNLLTVVAILGCLPASKSLVETVIYFRYRGCSKEQADIIEEHSQGLQVLYDMVFTAYEKNYEVKHLAVKGNTLCGFSDAPGFDAPGFYKHIDSRLKADSFRDVTVKIFTNLPKYTERLEQLKALSGDETNTPGIINTLKSVSL
ncbi:MAG: hypothetical protein NC081_02215 [Roseburia sp.]|nr:hypothetical protein [Roseburia sp.]